MLPFPFFEIELFRRTVNGFPEFHIIPEAGTVNRSKPEHITFGNPSIHTGKEDSGKIFDLHSAWDLFPDGGTVKINYCNPDFSVCQ